ncbi:unnamed protein product, partial [Effrenium voratum]
ARRNIKAALRKLRKDGVDPTKQECCVDIAAGVKFQKDMVALQGFHLSESTGATGTVSEAQLGGMLGNSMSVPVLCQAVKSALLAS